MILRVLHLPPKKKPHGHPHEAPPLMLVPYLLLALTALALGLAWGATSKTLGSAISMSLGIAESASAVAKMLHPEITGVTYTTLGWVGISLAIVAGLYLVVKPDFDKILATSKAARALHDFLFDRWYINAIIYIVIVGGFWAASIALEATNSLIDALYHTAIPVLFALGAAGLRALHRGRSDYYLMLYAYFAGTLLLFLYLVWR